MRMGGAIALVMVSAGIAIAEVPATPPPPAPKESV